MRPAVKTSKDRKEGFEKVFERIYRMVLRIPRGRVMTYGQIARILDERFSPRLVGWAMHATPHDERNIPWHRVINSRGGVSTGKVIPHEPELQRLLLEAEGIKFDQRGSCDLAAYQWSPRRRGSISLRGSKRASAPTSRKPSVARRRGKKPRGQG